MLDLIGIGDTSLDTFLFLSNKDINLVCPPKKDGEKNNDSNCLLCVSFANKIPVLKTTATIGGNSCNVAIGAARLGLRSALVTQIGDDEIGHKIKNTLKQEKVKINFVINEKNKNTNHTVALNHNGERTLFVFHEKRIFQLPLKIPKARWIYLSSMGKGWTKILPRLFNYLEKKKVKMAYNPGTFQLKIPPALQKKIIKRTEILFLNKEEAAFLLGKRKLHFRHPHHPIKDKTARFVYELAENLCLLGPKIVVITDGQNGSYGFSSLEKTLYYLPPLNKKRLETTGAGDSYAAGFWAAIEKGSNLPEAMRWGSFNATSVVSKIGPQAGLLTLAEMKKWLKKYPRFQTKKI